MKTNINIDSNWNRNSWNKISSELKSQKSTVITLFILLIDIVLITTSLCLWAISNNIIPSLISLIILPVPLTHFYLLNHEATHRSLSNNTFVNDIIGHLLGWAIFLPFLPRQRSHILHHIWTGHPKGDPANARMIKAFTVMTKNQEKKLELVWKFWIPVLIFNDRKGLWLDAFNRNRELKEYKKLSKERKYTWIYLTFYILLLIAIVSNGLVSFIWSLYLPALFILFAIEELINLPHHAETTLLNESDRRLPYWSQHYVTHSCQTVPVWSRFILLNFNLHITHHFFPWIPWFALPEAHRKVSQLLPEVDEEIRKTTNEFNWSIKNRRSNLLSILGCYKLKKID